MDRNGSGQPGEGQARGIRGRGGSGCGADSCHPCVATGGLGRHSWKPIHPGALNPPYILRLHLDKEVF